MRDTFTMPLQLPAVLDALPMHRDKVERACGFGLSVPEILGMAIAGSFAAGGADIYSDVDLRVVVEDAALDAVFARRTEMSLSCGTVVAGFTGEHVGDPHLLIVLYDDLVHVDFDFTRLSDLAADNQGRSGLVLWERGDHLSRRLPGDHHPDRRGELSWIESRFWTWIWYVQSKILPGRALRGTRWPPVHAEPRPFSVAGDHQGRPSRRLSPSGGAGWRPGGCLRRHGGCPGAPVADAGLDLDVPEQDAARRIAQSALDAGITYRTG